MLCTTCVPNLLWQSEQHNRSIKASMTIQRQISQPHILLYELLMRDCPKRKETVLSRRTFNPITKQRAKLAIFDVVQSRLISWTRSVDKLCSCLGHSQQTQFYDPAESVSRPNHIILASHRHYYQGRGCEKPHPCSAPASTSLETSDEGGMLLLSPPTPVLLHILYIRLGRFPGLNCWTNCGACSSILDSKSEYWTYGTSSQENRGQALAHAHVQSF